MTGPVARWRGDRDAWRALGEGGLPANGIGWSIASALRLLAREPLDTARYGRPSTAPSWLPPRTGPRPTVGRHPVPHRQLDQPPSDVVRRDLADLVEQVVLADPARLHRATSRFERHGPAAFVTDPTGAPPWVRRARGEIAHVHPTDGSLHVVLRPGDAAAVIDHGWGERHPLAGVRGLRLPDTYLLLYAPRDHDELRVVRRIVDRAARDSGPG